MKHSLHTFRISCEFCVLLIPQKNKPQNLLSFHVNADPGAKYSEMRKAKKGAQNIPLYTFRFSYFRVFRDKWIVSLRVVK